MELSKRPDRNNNFNLLRLVLATLVLVSHTFEIIDGNRAREPLTNLFGTLSFGELAVNCFFLLSGYLIVQSWQHGAKPFVFLANRALRIYPGFVVAFLISLLVVAPIGAEVSTYYSAIDVTKTALDLIRLSSPQAPPFNFAPVGGAINGSMWTIRYEFRCYLGVLIFGSLGFITIKRPIWPAAVLLTVCVYAAMVICTRYGFKPEIMGRYPLNNQGNFLAVRLSMFFIVGGLFYLYQHRINFNRKTALGFAIALVVCLSHWLLAEPALAFFGGYLLLFLAFHVFGWTNRFNKLPDVSYGVYLYGWPIQLLVIWKLSHNSPWLVLFVSAVASLAAGTLSWYVIEKPFMSLRRAFRV